MTFKDIFFREKSENLYDLLNLLHHFTFLNIFELSFEHFVKVDYKSFSRFIFFIAHFFESHFNA